MGDPGDFYDRTRAWDVAAAPSRDLIQSARQTAATAQAAATGTTSSNSTAPVAPYYVQLKLPGEDELEYVLLRPFVRASQDDENKNLLSAFMVANSNDVDTYGDLNVYEMTSQGVEGPTIVDSNIRSDQTVALVLNRLSEGGSEVKAGNLFLVPMDEESMIWVRPVYVQARGGDDVVEVPQLRFVIVVSDAGVIMQRSLSAALYETLLQSGYTRAEALEVLVPIFGNVDSPIDLLAVVEGDGDLSDEPEPVTTAPPTTTEPPVTTSPPTTSPPSTGTGGAVEDDIDEIRENQQQILDLLRELTGGTTAPTTTTTTLPNDEA